MMNNIINRKQPRNIMALLVVLTVSACGGGSDATGTGTGAEATASFSRLILPGDECEAGGVQIDTGIDENANGLLDQNEIDESQVICNGVDGVAGNSGENGYSSLVNFTEIAAGSNCELGGVKVEAGIDVNTDSELQSTEITDTEYLCTLSAEIGYPVVMGAVATSNTSINVSFSKEMGSSVTNTDNYQIVQTYINAEVGNLIVQSVTMLSFAGENTIVELITSPQNELTYSLTAIGLSDVNGTAIPGVIETLGGLLDTSSVNFAGSAPQAINISASFWDDRNSNGIVDVGDVINNEAGIQFVLVDYDNDGVVDNWNDIDGSGSVTPADTISGFLDSDLDGLPDHEEVYGRSIVIDLANGSQQTMDVTSDPYLADTDGDFLTDLEEKGIGSNPRSVDTDSDSLSDNTEWNVVYSDPNNQDSDGDDLIDGLEHDFYHTSPLLADSDGDSLDDNVEILELNRNPRIADLPQFNIIVGDIRLQIDERYSYVDESGQTVTQESSSSTSLSNTESDSTFTSNTAFSESTGSATLSGGAGAAGYFGGTGSTSDSTVWGVQASATAGGTNSTSTTNDSEEIRESQEAYENSLSKGRELSTTSTVNREITGARIDIDISFENVGDIPFTISNVEISVLQPIGNSGDFLPVATLISNSQLISGNLLEVNLGAFNNRLGPFIFSSREVFANLIEDLMRNPVGLVYRVANYDITDELGRNYSFASQLARDRTAGITLDYGDADNASTFFVATHGAQTDEGYIGGFDAESGQSVGLPIHYVMQNILNIPRQNTAQDFIDAGQDSLLQTVVNPESDDARIGNRIFAGVDGWLETIPTGDDYIDNPSVPNGIVAGENQTADSIAIGDDIQLVPFQTTGLSVGTIVIDPGANNILDTEKSGDDQIEFVAGYETSKSCTVESDFAGFKCRINSECADINGLNIGVCDGPDKLVRINSLRDGDFNRGWVVFSSGNLPGAADFDRIIVEAGEDIGFAFVQDLDLDGIPARNEFLFGSTDSSIDRYDNSDFGPGFDRTTESPDGFADSRDSDADGLDDFAEVYIGWQVSADGGALKTVFSSPRFRDTDGDLLEDSLEKDLSDFCIADDPRIDGLCNPDSSEPPATNPALRDTDVDGITDYTELTGFESGLAIVDGGNGVAESIQNADDIQRAFPGNPVFAGGVVMLPGNNAVIDSVIEQQIDPAGDDYRSGSTIFCGPNLRVDTRPIGDDIVFGAAVYGSTCVSSLTPVLVIRNGFSPDTLPNNIADDIIRFATPDLTTDPLRRDTDSDSFPDGFELVIGSDPTMIDADDFTDSDLDGLTDNEELILGWLVSVNGGADVKVNSAPSLPDSDFDGLPDFVERDLRTHPFQADTDGDGISDYDEVNDLSAYSSLAAIYPGLTIPANTGGFGTDPNSSDSDGDGLSDYVELIDGVSIILPGDNYPQTVFTNPLDEDSDRDSVNDRDEVEIYNTDPNNSDSDGDGRSDGSELAIGSDPLTPDVAVTLTFEQMNTVRLVGDGTNGEAELTWWFVTEAPEDSNPVLLTDPRDVEHLPNFLWDFGFTFPTNSCFIKVLDPTRVYSMTISNSARTIILQPGQSFSLNGLIGEIDSVSPDCGMAPRYIPTWIDDAQSGTSGGAGCIIQYNEVFSYEDFVGGSSIELQSIESEDNSCEVDILYTIEVE